MMGGTRRPFHWKDEVTGVLHQAVANFLTGRDLTDDQVALVRGYLKQWINDDRWRGTLVDVLRTQVAEIATRADIERWLDRAIDAGVDPL